MSPSGIPIRSPNFTFPTILGSLSIVPSILPSRRAMPVAHRQEFHPKDGDSRAIHGPIGLIRGGLAAGEVPRESGDPVLDLRPDEVAGHRRASTW